MRLELVGTGTGVRGLVGPDFGRVGMTSWSWSEQAGLELNGGERHVSTGLGKVGMAYGRLVGKQLGRR